MLTMPDYIFDTTALSNFSAANRLDLLEKRYYDKAFITLEVADELRKGVKAGYSYLSPVLKQISGVNPEGWIQIVTPNAGNEYSLRFQFDKRLDPGEASCISLAITRKFIFVSDDLAARRIASKNDIPITGTIGILIALVRNNRLPLGEANRLLQNMIQKNYRSPVNHLDELI